LNRIADKVKVQSASVEGGIQYPLMVDSLNTSPTAETVKTPNFIQIHNAKRAFIVQGKIVQQGSSLTIESGSISASGNFFTAGAITASGDISASGNISAGRGMTGSFDHIITTDNTIEFRSKTNPTGPAIGFLRFDETEGIQELDNNRAPKHKIADKIAGNRRIGGVLFTGLANIDLPGVNTTGNQNTTGRADTATLAAELPH